MKKSLFMLLTLCGTMMLYGCGPQQVAPEDSDVDAMLSGQLETAGEAANEAAEAITNEVGDAADAVSDGANELAEDAGDAIDEAADALSDAVAGE